MESFTICLFVIELFHLAQCSQSSAMLQHMSELPSYLRLKSISLYVHTTFCLSIHQSVDTWVASTFQLLWIILLWTWVHKYLFGTLLSNLSGKYPEDELLSHMEILFLIFWCTAILFSTVAIPFYLPTNSAKECQLLHTLTNIHFLFLS